MKRVSLFLACIFLTFACSEVEAPSNAPTADPVLTITSNTEIWFDSSGGDGEITYTIEKGQTGVSLTTKCNADWITNITVGESVTYTVTENDTNEERRGTIELCYGTITKQVIIKQRTPYSTYFEALTTSGSYYMGGEGLYNYYIVLSINGMSESGYLQGYSTYYYFDLYSSTPANDNKAIIPNGTYRLTSSYNLKNGDILSDYSNLTETDDSQYFETYYKDAEVVVSDGNIVAKVTFANGERHLITYNGSLEIPFDSSIGGDNGGNGGGNSGSGFSTLTSDHYFDINGGVFVGALVGDLLYNGYDTCQVYMYEYLDYETGEERGDQFQIDLQLPRGTTDICGTYTEGTTAGHFIPGSAEDVGGGQYMSVNSWYNTAGYVDFAPLIKGSVKVEKDNSGMYIFTIDTVDDIGNAIKGIFRGYGELIEW